MKNIPKYIALYVVCFLISAITVAAMELAFNAAIDLGNVLTISIGPTLCIGTFYLLRLIKKEAAEKANKK